MRIAIYLLVAANLALFALAGGLVAPPPDGDAGATGELSPGRIRIVSRGEPPAARATVAESTAPPVASPATVACAEWAALTREQADRIAQASEASGIVLVRTVAVPDSTRWWVNIPPLAAGRPGAEKKVAELRRLGVRRFSIVEDEGEHRNAISFGRYASEAEAQRVIDGLRQKGVRSARLSVEAAGDGRERLVARGPADSVTALRAEVAEWPPTACTADPTDASAAPAARPATPARP